MKNKTESASLLQKPLNTLEFSNVFIECSGKLGFHSLEQISAKGWAGLRAMDGFTFIWFNELVKFLEKHELLYVLEEEE